MQCRPCDGFGFPSNGITGGNPPEWQTCLTTQPKQKWKTRSVGHAMDLTSPLTGSPEGNPRVANLFDKTTVKLAGVTEAMYEG